MSAFYWPNTSLQHIQHKGRTSQYCMKPLRVRRWQVLGSCLWIHGLHRSCRCMLYNIHGKEHSGNISVLKYTCLTYSFPETNQYRHTHYYARVIVWPYNVAKYRHCSLLRHTFILFCNKNQLRHTKDYSRAHFTTLFWCVVSWFWFESEQLETY